MSARAMNISDCPLTVDADPLARMSCSLLIVQLELPQSRRLNVVTTGRRSMAPSGGHFEAVTVASSIRHAFWWAFASRTWRNCGVAVLLQANMQIHYCRSASKRQLFVYLITWVLYISLHLADESRQHMQRDEYSDSRYVSALVTVDWIESGLEKSNKVLSIICLICRWKQMVLFLKDITALSHRLFSAKCTVTDFSRTRQLYFTDQTNATARIPIQLNVYRKSTFSQILES